MMMMMMMTRTLQACILQPLPGHSAMHMFTLTSIFFRKNKKQMFRCERDVSSVQDSDTKWTFKLLKRIALNFS
jgi:hypothetical protein